MHSLRTGRQRGLTVISSVCPPVLLTALSMVTLSPASTSMDGSPQNATPRPLHSSSLMLRGR